MGRPRGQLDNILVFERHETPEGLYCSYDNVANTVTRVTKLQIFAFSPAALHVRQAECFCRTGCTHADRFCIGADGRSSCRFARSEEHTSELQSLMRISYD